jgi:hypothetical protein
MSGAAVPDTAATSKTKSAEISILTNIFLTTEQSKIRSDASAATQPRSTAPASQAPKLYRIKASNGLDNALEPKSRPSSPFSAGSIAPTSVAATGSRLHRRFATGIAFF